MTFSALPDEMQNGSCEDNPSTETLRTVENSNDEEKSSQAIRTLRSYSKRGRGKNMALAYLNKNISPSPKKELFSSDSKTRDKSNQNKIENDTPPSTNSLKKDSLKTTSFSPPRKESVFDSINKTSPFTPKKEILSDKKDASFSSPTNYQKNNFSENNISKRKLSSEFFEVEKKRQKEISPEEAYIGLANIGNSCYINSVLQALKSLKCFMFDLTNCRTNELKNVNGLQKVNGVDFLPDDCVFKTFFEVMKNLHCAKNGQIIDPSALKLAVSNNSSRFQGLFQEDAHEFLCDLLNQIQENVILFFEKPILNQKIQKIQKFEFKKLNCPVAKNFSCFIDLHFKCLYCDHITKTKELFRNLSLDFPETTLNLNEQGRLPPIHVQTLLQRFFQDEKVEKTCENCKYSSSMIKRKIFRLPRILVLHLKRFSINGNSQCKKRVDRVHASKWIDLGSFCSNSTRNPLPFEKNESSPNLSQIFSSNRHDHLHTSTSSTSASMTSSISTQPSNALENPAKRQKSSIERVSDTGRVVKQAPGESNLGHSSESELVQTEPEPEVRENVRTEPNRSALQPTGSHAMMDVDVDMDMDAFNDSAEDMDLQKALTESLKESFMKHRQSGEGERGGEKDEGEEREKGKEEMGREGERERERKRKYDVNDPTFSYSKEAMDLDAAIALSLASPLGDKNIKLNSSSLPSSSPSSPLPSTSFPKLDQLPLVEIHDSDEEEGKDEQGSEQRKRSWIGRSKEKEKEICLTKYKLKSIINHLGNSSLSGHFVTDVIHSPSSSSPSSFSSSPSNQWLRHNDSVVSQVSEAHVLNPESETENYLLFYVHESLQ